MEKASLPIGFIMSITQNKDALKYFVTLDENIKSKICRYIQDSATNIESKRRINTSIEGLANHNLRFLG